MAEDDQALWLPNITRQIISRVRIAERHPGLQLDKLSLARNQEEQKATLDRMCIAKGDENLLAELLARRALQFTPNGAAIEFDALTTSALTLHLARASALENAGICLHPVYGFAYIPGSAIKGMARAYAEAVWVPAGPNSAEEWFKIERVFGWAPGSEKRKRWRPDLPIPPDASTGSVVFHDSWPRSWPRLFVDIINNHHAQYYSGGDAPGDWEDPNPVYFLAVQPGATFSFVLTPRRTATARDDLGLARDFLIGALTLLGVGAKTNAGYGCFRLMGEDTAAEKPSDSLLSENFELELITPAFLAGAGQSQDDCDLRPATLRGLLRWWWRTMHCGFVDEATLRALEAAVRGDTRTGGAIRISLQRRDGALISQYDKASIRDQHQLERPPDQKTTQGLFYHSFGMDDERREKGRRIRRQRYFAPPGAKWLITVTARRSSFQDERSNSSAEKSEKSLSPERLMEQSKAALWLLCHFGGVGSKAHKGFGSFQEPPALAQVTIPQCMKSAEALRSDFGLAQIFSPGLAATASLQELLPWKDLVTPWRDCWFGLDQVGYAAQEFAKKYKHHREKQGLGLPRNIGPPEQGQFQPHPTIRNRHSSPVHYHLARNQDGTLTVRIAAFPAARLPTKEASRTLLSELLAHLNETLESRVARPHPDAGPTRGPSRAGSQPKGSNPFMPKTPRGGRAQPGGRGPKRR